MGSSRLNTRLRMIHAAVDLFHRQGVNATSVDQVLAKSGTGKSQFTHYFKNKEGMIHAVLQHLHEVIRNGETPTGYEIKSWKDLDGWFQKYIDYQESVAFERSCPIGTVGNDVANEQKLLRQDIRLFMEWCRSQFVIFFSKKQAAGELATAADPEALTDFCISIMQGGMLLTKITRDPSIFENAAAQALAYIHSLRR